jgi:hypothetical protein
LLGLSDTTVDRPALEAAGARYGMEIDTVLPLIGDLLGTM